MQTCQANGSTHAYFDQGQGTPVVLLHGFPLDHTMWEAQLRLLSEEYRVIAPDLRGFGRTPLGSTDQEAAEKAAAGVSMREYADDLAAILDAVGITEPVVLVGFSMGGYIAWQFWKHHRPWLAALVLADTRAIADTPQVASGRLKMAEHIEEWGAARVGEMMKTNLFAPATIQGRPDLTGATQRVIAATDPKAIAAAQRGLAARPDVTDWLPQIDVPCQLIVGKEDAISPVEEMQTIAAALPEAELRVVSNAGHMAPVENPDEFNQSLLEFLRRSRS